MIEQRGPKCWPKVKSSMLQSGCHRLAVSSRAARPAILLKRSTHWIVISLSSQLPAGEFTKPNPKNFAVPTKNLHPRQGQNAGSMWL